MDTKIKGHRLTMRQHHKQERLSLLKEWLIEQTFIYCLNVQVV
jgi:hypothetical protein